MLMWLTRFFFDHGIVPMVWYCLFISLYELDNVLEYNLLIICRYLKFVKKTMQEKLKGNKKKNVLTTLTF
jgi:hypothetical protein